MAGTLEETVAVYCDGDFKPHMPSVSGRKALAQRLKIALTTQRGRVSWWPNRGTDLRAYLLSKVPANRIADSAKTECEIDEQVQRADVQADIQDSGKRVRLFITIWEWPPGTMFTFTMTISDAAATLIELQAS